MASGKKGIFRRFIDAIKRFFGIKTEEEKLMETKDEDEPVEEQESELGKLQEELGIMKAPEGYGEDKKTEAEQPAEVKPTTEKTEESSAAAKKSGGSTMVVVPSSNVPKKSSTETAEPAKKEETAEEEAEKEK